MKPFTSQVVMGDLLMFLARFSHAVRLTTFSRAMLAHAARTNCAERMAKAAALALELGFAADAEIFAKQALALDQSDSRSRHVLAGSLIQLQLYSQSASEYQKIVAANPEDATALYNLGVCLSNLDRWEEAIDAFSRAVQLQPGAVDASSRLGIAYTQAGRPELATVWLTKALRLEPSVSAYVNLAVNLLDRGDVEEAEKQLRDGLKRFPDSDELKLRFAFALAQQQKWSEASEVQRSVRSMPQEPDSLLVASGIYRAAGDPQAAVAAALNAARVAPQSAAPYAALGLTYLKLGRPADADQAFDAGLSRDAAHPECFAGKMAVLVTQGKLLEAKELQGRVRPEDLVELEGHSEFAEYLTRLRSDT